MSRRLMQWVLFFAATATFPVIFFMFVVGGLLPVSAIVRLLFTGEWGFKLFTAIHLVIYLPLFYFAAWLIARGLSRLPVPLNYIAFAVLIAMIVALAFLPLYGLGHNEYHGVNLYELFRGEMLR